MDTIEIIGAAIGLVYIVLEYRANRWMWLCGVVMPAIYAYIYFRHGLYANASFNVYNIAISAYGLWQWRRGRSGGELPIRSMPRRALPWLLLVVAGLTVGLALLLSLLQESRVPLLDGLTASLGIAGMWMLARKYYQQWLCWLVVNPLTMAMCLATGLWATAALYGAYEAIAVKGYLRWRREVR